MNPVISLDEFRSRYGDSTMPIHLGGETYTPAPAPDTRLRRLVQVTSDLAVKPVGQLRDERRVKSGELPLVDFYFEPQTL